MTGTRRRPLHLLYPGSQNPGHRQQAMPSGDTPSFLPVPCVRLLPSSNSVSKLVGSVKLAAASTVPACPITVSPALCEAYPPIRLAEPQHDSADHTSADWRDLQPRSTNQDAGTTTAPRSWLVPHGSHRNHGSRICAGITLGVRSD
jgi:hypothetical protein